MLTVQSKITLQRGLPHLHGWKWYPWAREFYESREKINLLCAANQISKSSTQIRKCIQWATDQTLWKTLWVNPPKQFWYLYPSQDVATAEFDTKWVQFMPCNEFKEDPIYGWKEKRDSKGTIKYIRFNSGVFVFFKTYSQDTQTLQTGTCDAIFCDEELPTEHYDELIFRISASNGYFHMVFTATLGQEFWRQCMEPGPEEPELLPEAKKWCVSIYQCREYEDGSPSHWTDERIQQVKNRCKNQNEVLRRVYGRFVYDGPGRKFEQFDIKRHMRPPHVLPISWLIYAGVDIGSGGTKGHPAAICFVGVSPDYRQGRIFLGWRGDGIQTTAGDVLEQYNLMVKEHRLNVEQCFYDHSSSDFNVIQARAGGRFEKAEKGKEIGEQILNVLFKNNLLYIYDNDELQKLATELTSLRKETPKEKAKDDFCDALRYACTKIPWDWEVITGVTPENAEPEKDGKPETAEEALKREVNERRAEMMSDHENEKARLEQEFSEWNEAFGES